MTRNQVKNSSGRLFVNFHKDLLTYWYQMQIFFDISSAKAFWLRGNKKLNPYFNEGGERDEWLRGG